jgi:hypothetical protein
LFFANRFYATARMAIWTTEEIYRKQKDRFLEELCLKTVLKIGDGTSRVVKGLMKM